MAKLRFTSIIRIRGINPFVRISAARAKAIRPEWRKPMPVLVRLNDQPLKAWRINMMPVGDGGFYLYLHEDVRKASGTAVGDRVRVEVEFDAAYRNGPQHRMPAWFKRELDEDLQATENWRRLSPSRKKEVLRYFSWLKSPAARQRNLRKAMAVLSGRSGRFMARDWEGGS